MLDACEAFFLGSGYNFAIHRQCGSAIVIKRGDAKNNFGHRLWRGFLGTDLFAAAMILAIA